MNEPTTKVYLVAIGIIILSIAAVMPVSAAGRMQDRFAPIRLAAASNLSQGFQPRMLAGAAALGVRDLRDGMRWGDVERTPGIHVFDRRTTAYPDAVAEAGATLTLTVNFGNALYDDGATPASPEALAAHAAYVEALVDRFPAIGTVEVGNEFNSAAFLRGPLRQADAAGRAAAHVAMLHPIAARVGDRVRILGGASHSLPLGYLWAVLDAGGAEAMDALAVHPYTTRPEEFPRQVAVLRRHPAARDLPLEVTEFGSERAEAAPGFLVRYLATMAVSGVERAVWYPLNPRGDGLVPLLDRGGRPTVAGRAYAFADARLAGRPARDVSPDPNTFAIRFGEDTLVLWGEPRAVTLDPAVTAFDAAGTPLAGREFTLAPEAPLVLLADGPVRLGEEIRLEPNPILADSYYDFAYPGADEAGSAPSRLERFVRRGGREIALRTMPGQERGGTLWVPYLGRDELYPLRVTPRSLLPRAGREPADIVHRWRAPRAGTVDVAAVFRPAPRSADGVTVTIAKGGETLAATTLRKTFRFAERLAFEAGETLELTVGAGANHRGDVTRYRIRIGAPGRLGETRLRR
jgi:hypothetical protein